MKKFVFLSYGFKPPTPEIMVAWGNWFGSAKDNIVEMGHLSGERELSAAGAKDLPMDLDAISGFVIVRAADRDEAEKIAASNPYISSIRFYELMTK